MAESHLSDHDLERYYLRMVTGEQELATLEEHILGCPECAEVQEYVEIMRAALLKVNGSSEEQEWRSSRLRSPRNRRPCHQPRRWLA